MEDYSPLPPVRRLVSAHNEKGEAVVTRDTRLCGEIQKHGSAVKLLWSSSSVPADVESNEDQGLVHTGLVNNGTVLRFVDLPPRCTGHMHRSISLDYITVMEGEVVLELDDGSKTTCKKGTVIVQQATMHAWSNVRDDWARILCCLVPAHAPTVNGKPLETFVHFHVK